MLKALKQIVMGAILGALIPVIAAGQSLLPNAKQQYLKPDGTPAAAGTVDYFVPGGDVRKNTWVNPAATTLSTNPVVLDALGRPYPTGQTFGSGSYRQVVKDVDGNVIWDAITASTNGGGGGGGSTPTVGDGQPVGSVQLWAGFTAPNQYVFAYGQQLLRGSYPEALSALTSLQTGTCTSSSPVLSGLSDTSQITVGTPLESTCFNAGTTILSKTVSTVTVSSNAIISSTASVRFFPWGNGNGVTTFNVPDLRGRVLAGRDNMGGVSANRLTAPYINANGIGATSGSQFWLLAQSALPNVSPTFTGTANQPLSVRSATNRIVQGDSINSTSLGSTGTGSVSGNNFAANSVDSTGTFTPSGVISSINGNVTQSTINLLQPTVIANYVVKVSPDTNPNSYFGVASIGGMTGVLTCGVGLQCVGNDISAVVSSNLNCNNIGNAGTACTANTGSSGHAVPFLDGNNIFSGGNSFPSGITINGNGASLVGRSAATSGVATDFALASLPARGAPDANNDKLLILDNVSGTFKYVTPGLIASAATSGVSSLGGQTGAVTCGTSLSCSSGNIQLTPGGFRTVLSNITNSSAQPTNVAIGTFAKYQALNITRSEIPLFSVDVGAFTTTGYNAAGDGGHGHYIKGTSTGICPIQDANSQWWGLDPTQKINVMACGAKGDDTNIDQPSFQLAVDGASQPGIAVGGVTVPTVYAPPNKKWKFNNTLNLNTPIKMEINGAIHYSGTSGTAFRVGTSTSFSVGYDLYIETMYGDGGSTPGSVNPTGTRGILLTNMVFSRMKVGTMAGFSLAAVDLDGSGGFGYQQIVQHNVLDFQQVVNNGYGMRFYSLNPATSSVQANRIIAGNVYQNYTNFLLDGPSTSATNSNTFVINAMDNEQNIGIDNYASLNDWWIGFTGSPGTSLVNRSNSYGNRFRFGNGPETAVVISYGGSNNSVITAPPSVAQLPASGITVTNGALVQNTYGVPIMVYFTVSMAASAAFRVDAGPQSAQVQTVQAYSAGGSGGLVGVSVRVPSGGYWRAFTTGGTVSYSTAALQDASL